MVFPEPVIQLSVEPKSKADQDKMTNCFTKTSRRRSIHSVHILTRKLDKLSSLVWVNFTLDIIVDRMRREFKVEANVGAPQVAYRETFRASASS